MCPRDDDDDDDDDDYYYYYNEEEEEKGRIRCMLSSYHVCCIYKVPP